MREQWNMPEPIDDMTAILFFTISGRYKTKVQIYNSIDKHICTILDEKKEPGEHIIRWNGTDNSGDKIPKGIYYYQVINGNFKSPKKTIML